MPSFSDFSFMSSTGENSLHARMCFPDCEPRAVIQIAHGIADYIGRYDEMAEFFASKGFLVVGNDHLGHGENIKDEFDVGFFAAQNGWNHVVADMDRLRGIIKEKYPSIPYIFLGHSMGSFLVRTYIIKHPDKYDAVILSGTGHMPPPLVLGGYALASAAVKKNGPRANGQFLNDIAFGSYNKRIENPVSPFDWVCSDPNEVAKYAADPWCGFAAKVSLYRDMMGGIKFIIDKKNIAKMSKTQPVYFYAGEEDPVGEYGKGVERAYKAFCKAGCMDVTMKLYPGRRHEMHNEPNKLQVFKDILDWINARFPI